MIKRSKFLSSILLFFTCFSFGITASKLHAEEFEVKDIRVDGLQRVSAGTVFSAFPVNVGDEVDSVRLVEASKNLFKSGLFTDIKLGREDNDLLITVVERPSISKIEIDGNKDISTDDLMDGLKSAGMYEGQVFQRVTMERLELEILRSYVAQGRYNASVDAEVEEQPRNRVAIKLNINEGDVASIKHINIVGNSAFSDEELLDLMELKTPGLFSAFTSDDKYAKEKLSGDLERIRSFYLDRGYIKFNIESTQVAISPTKEDVFLTLNITEGPLYTIRDIQLKGELIVDEDEIRRLVLVKEGDTFSRRLLTTTSDIISRRLGTEGYTFANVNAIPEPHDDNSATVTFFVDPGRRTYVRRINFRGNVNTADEVLRQEMRQMEGGSASTNLIETSKSRLERLGFFKTVTVETPAVPGSADQVDVNYSVEEQASGSLSASLGFSQDSGFILGFNVSENNFFGTGRRVSMGLNTSKSVKSARFSYLNPYYTVDGVSRGFSVFAKETDFDNLNTSAYILDTIGGSVTFGYPINNFSRLNFGLTATNDKLEAGDESALEIVDFVNENGDNFDNLTVDLSWTRNTLNRGLFATQGLSQSFSTNITTPQISDLQFFKANYRTNFYQPVDRFHKWVFRLRSDIGYGDGYGDTSELPFYENYFAGGMGSVRGYESNTLGLKGTQSPTDSSAPRAFGGNILIEGSAELIFPIPFVDDQSSMRTALFFDAGNVFDSSRDYNPELSELRMSTGISFQWVTAIGPLGFALAKALNDQEGDDTQIFQFTLGQNF
ncbi:outer membrane protein assembly factor BamA [Alkalimarinus sediminis]|uniref:Outer membrane protein assembly factor BamA n=1 Tax=Alkalimarinus sediminis TaxID=1632866 RepID=A0A9E8KPD8_9ALTE|nr:outer membrane protein assembly factor BamA [Alkalimarinus sediminis]UZW73387.1 outer membrane protein assembly factor BamA [Alkalimarinus sediminis]